MEIRDPRLRQVWRQSAIPVVLRRPRPDPLLIRLPYAPDNFHWLRNDHRYKPTWNPTYTAWETPIAWFEDVIERILHRYGRVYIIQSYNAQQKCAPACWNAKGAHCECSCMGRNHGKGRPVGQWRAVSDTFAFSWGPRQYACRLVSAQEGGYG